MDGILILLNDAIKILGPAFIVGWFAYKTGLRQLEIKLRELKVQNEFTARSRMFDYYKKRRDKIKDDLASSSKLVGTTMVLTDSEIEEDLGTWISLLNSYTKIGLLELKNTADIIKSKEFKIEDEVRLEIDNYIAKFSELPKIEDGKSVKERVLLLNEALTHISYCNDKMLGELNESMFDKYLDLKDDKS